jgi:hypothetical protein
VLGAWKFQQGEICNCEAIWPRVSCVFLFLSQAGKSFYFQPRKRHTCEKKKS